MSSAAKRTITVRQTKSGWSVTGAWFSTQRFPTLTSAESFATGKAKPGDRILITELGGGMVSRTVP